MKVLQSILCTPEEPWDHKPTSGVVRHTDVEEIGEQRDGWPAGDIQRMRCRNCGHEWDEELPQ